MDRLEEYLTELRDNWIAPPPMRPEDVVVRISVAEAAKQICQLFEPKPERRVK